MMTDKECNTWFVQNLTSSWRFDGVSPNKIHIANSKPKIGSQQLPDKTTTIVTTTKIC